MSAHPNNVAAGESQSHFHHREHHVIPLRVYYGVYGVLLVLTVLTVGVSYADLGSASLMAAMIVAVVKAALVAGYFMHLKYDERFNSFVFFSSILFLAIMFALTLVDLGTRGVVDPTLDNFALQKDRTAQKSMDEAAAAAAQKAASVPAGQPAVGTEPAPAEQPAEPDSGGAPPPPVEPGGGAAPDPAPVPAKSKSRGAPTEVSPTPTPNP